jgi:hypothetical protein
VPGVDILEEEMTDLNAMWEALARYQPYADADGHGESWRKMCERRTQGTAARAASAAYPSLAALAYSAARLAEDAAGAASAAYATAWAAETAEAAADVAYWSDRAIERIESAIKEREPVPSNIEPTSNVSGQAQKMDAQPEPVAFYNFQTHRMRWAKPTSYAKIVTVDMPELALYTIDAAREVKP